MRKACRSSSTSATTRFSSRAEARSRPKGFSITTLDHGEPFGGGGGPAAGRAARRLPREALDRLPELLAVGLGRADRRARRHDSERGGEAAGGGEAEEGGGDLPVGQGAPGGGQHHR